MQYKELVDIYKELEAKSKRLNKTFIISKFLKKTKTDDINKIILLLQGYVFPQYSEKKIGVASKLVSRAISLASGLSVNKVEESWKTIGDLGEVAEKFIEKKNQSTLFQQKLTVKKVFENIKKLASLEGQGSVDQKVKLITELLTSAEPLEARYIVRTVLEDLRVGVGEGSIRDSIVWAFFENEIGFKYLEKDNDFEVKDRELYKKYVNAVQEAFNVTTEFAVVATAAKENGLKGLEKLKLKIGKPIKVMLYQKVEDITHAFERVGTPCAFEFKYDGFRLQLHKHKDKIQLFTRNLEDVSRQFPDVIKAIRENTQADSFILDAEAVGLDMKTKKYLPFQEISQRIKRKHNIAETIKRLPVVITVFDIIEFNGKNLTKEPFQKRREALNKIVKEQENQIELAKQIITDNVKEAEKFYKKALSLGLEGVMAKNLEGIYKPGSRVGYGVKVKPVMENLDLVIVGAEWGTGKRATWLSSYVLACKKEDQFLEIGKVGTGIKEKVEMGVSFDELTKLLKPLVTTQTTKTVKVKPKIIIEVAYEEIQKSPTYSSGYALRFPRLIRLRTDERDADDCDTLERVEDLYYLQKKR